MKLSVIITLLLAPACGGGSNSSVANGSAPMMESSDIASDRVYAPSEAPPPIEGQPEQAFEKKIIKTGNVHYRVNNALEEYDRVVNILPGFKAYIASENQNESYDRINYEISIKVPPQHFDSLLGKLIEDKKVDNKYVNIDDVTDQYYDLKSRIANKEKLEERYQDILKKATTIKDILEIERNLNQVRTEIESLEGQLKLLSYRIDFSTLSIRFYEILPYQLDDRQRPGFGARFINSLAGGWEGFLTFIVFMVRLWPFAIIVAIIVIALRRYRARNLDKEKE